MRIQRILSRLLCLFCLAWPMAVLADIAVVVHPDNPVSSMTQREVSDLYLGRARSYNVPGQRISAVVYEHTVASPLREAFFRSLNGMSLNHLNAYWARLRFSGEVLPPQGLADSQAVIEVVSRNPAAIGYVDAAYLNNSVKVVLRLKE